MPTLHKRTNFSESELGLQIKNLLEAMTADLKFNTVSSYSPNAELYSDNLMPFVDKHMNYLVTHPAINPQEYLANLRLKTRLR